MAKRNLTIQLDEELIDRVRVIAAERETSISGLVRQQLEHLATDKTEYERARKIALRYLRRPFHMGGIRPTREELHDRKSFR